MSTVRAGLVWSYASYAIGVGGSLLALPLYLKAFGPVKYGLWASLLDLLGYLSLLNFGISHAVSSRVSRAYGAGDHVAIRHAVRSGVSAYVRTCGLAAPFLLTACWFAPWTRMFHLAPELASEARWAALFACSTLLFDLPLSILRVALIGLAQVSLTQIVVLSVVLLRLAVAWLCARVQPSLPVGIAALWAAQLVGHIAFGLSLWRKLPPVGTAPATPSNTTIERTLRSESLPYFIIQISSAVLGLTDTPITAMTLGTADAARVAVASRITTSLIGLGALVGPAVAPSLVVAWTRGEKDPARAIGVRGARDLMAVVGCASAAAYAFGERAFGIWLGPDMFVGPLAWTLYCVYVAIQGPTMIPDAFLMQLGVPYRYVWVACAESALKIVLTVVLLRLMGIAGLPLALVLSRALTRVPYLPIAYAARLEMSTLTWLRQAAWPPLAASAVFLACYLPVRFAAGAVANVSLLAGIAGLLAFGFVYLRVRRTLDASEAGGATSHARDSHAPNPAA